MNTSSFRRSPRPDTFWDSPSSSEEEFDVFSSLALPHHSPLPPHILDASYSPQTSIPVFRNSAAWARLADRQRELPSTPCRNSRVSVKIADSNQLLKHLDLQGNRGSANVSEPSDLGSLSERAVTGQARSVCIGTPGSGKLVHNSSPRTSCAFDERSRDGKGVSLPEDEDSGYHKLRPEGLSSNAGAAQSAGLQKELPGAGVTTLKRQRSSSAPATRKIVVMPPPIDTSCQHPVSRAPIRTPFPYQCGWQDSYKMSSPSTSATKDCTITLGIQRRGAKLSPKKASIPVPGNRRDPEVLQMQGRRKGSATNDFDDKRLFQQLRIEYARLSGPWRFLSARTLRRITMCHSASCLEHHRTGAWGPHNPSHGGCDIRGFCRHNIGGVHPPIAPFSTLDLKDRFSEEQLLHYYHNPGRAGKGKHEWVDWLIEMSATETGLTKKARVPFLVSSKPSESAAWQDPMAKDGQACGKRQTTVIQTVVPGSHDSISDPDESLIHAQAIGMVFVEGWSWPRICLALLAVLMLALSGVLLWTIWGPDWHSNSVVGAAAARFEAGLMLGGFALLFGWTIVLGWLAVSWLVE